MKRWVKWLVLGILSLLLGLFVLANPIAASFAVTLVAGFIFAAIGAAQMFAGIASDDGMSKFIGIGLGLLLLLLGISLMYQPLQGIISLALLATILIGANGVVRLIASWQMRQTPLFWPMLMSGALSVLLAGYILANFATVGPQLLGILLGIELLFNGAGLIALALFLRTAKGAMKEEIERQLDK